MKDLEHTIRSNVIICVIPIKIQHNNVKQRRQIFGEQF